MYRFYFKYHLRGYAPIVVESRTFKAAVRKAKVLGADFSRCDECGDSRWYFDKAVNIKTGETVEFPDEL